MAKRVFISYSRTDKAYVEKLADSLTERGVPAWYDAEIGPGTRFAKEIEEKIDESAAVVVVLTPAAVASEWVRAEIGHAKANGIQVFPLVLRRCNPPLEIGTLQYESVRGGRMPSARMVAHLKTLTAASSEVAGRPTPKADPERTDVLRSIFNLTTMSSSGRTTANDPATAEAARQDVEVVTQSLLNWILPKKDKPVSTYTHPATRMLQSVVALPVSLWAGRAFAEYCLRKSATDPTYANWGPGVLVATSAICGFAFFFVLAELLQSRTSAPIGTDFVGVWVAGLLTAALWAVGAYVALDWSGVVAIPLPAWLPWAPIVT